MPSSEESESEDELGQLIDQLVELAESLHNNIDKNTKREVKQVGGELTGLVKRIAEFKEIIQAMAAAEFKRDKCTHITKVDKKEDFNCLIDNALDERELKEIIAKRWPREVFRITRLIALNEKLIDVVVPEAWKRPIS